MTIQPQNAAAGWYPQGNGVQRYWDGQAWTDHTAVAQQQPAYVQPVYVQGAGPTRMVTKSKRHTSHTFHLIMTILTAGVWGLFVWLPMTVLNNMHREKSVTRLR